MWIRTESLIRTMSPEWEYFICAVLCIGAGALSELAQQQHHHHHRTTSTIFWCLQRPTNFLVRARSLWHVSKGKSVSTATAACSIYRVTSSTISGRTDSFFCFVLSLLLLWAAGLLDAQRDAMTTMITLTFGMAISWPRLRHQKCHIINHLNDQPVSWH